MCLFRVIVEDFEEELGVAYTKPVRNQNCSPTSHVFVYFHVRYQCSSPLAQWKKCLRDYKYHKSVQAQQKRTQSDQSLLTLHNHENVGLTIIMLEFYAILSTQTPTPQKPTMRPRLVADGNRVKAGPPPGGTGVNLSSHELLVYGCFQK